MRSLVGQVPRHLAVAPRSVDEFARDAALCEVAPRAASVLGDGGALRGVGPLCEAHPPNCEAEGKDQGD